MGETGRSPKRRHEGADQVQRKDASQLGANLPSQPPGTLAARQGILGWGWGEPRASHYPGLGGCSQLGKWSRKDQGGSLKGPASLPPGVPLCTETQATVSRPLILGMCVLKPSF